MAKFEEDVPLQGIIGSSVVGFLLGGIAVYGFFARTPQTECHIDVVGSVWGLLGLVGGVVIAWYFERRAQSHPPKPSFWQVVTAIAGAIPAVVKAAGSFTKSSPSRTGDAKEPQGNR